MGLSTILEFFFVEFPVFHQKFWVKSVESPRVNILAEIALYLFPLCALQKFLPPLCASKISSPSNLNLGVIPPWLEKILNLTPLKFLEMLPNGLDMGKLSD